MLYAKTGTMLMGYRILLRKMLFLWHVANLPPNTLANQVYQRECQQDTSITSLVTEVKPYLEEFGIYDLKLYSKYQFKKVVKSKLFEKNKADVLAMAQNHKKVSQDVLSRDSF